MGKEEKSKNMSSDLEAVNVVVVKETTSLLIQQIRHAEEQRSARSRQCLKTTEYIFCCFVAFPTACLNGLAGLSSDASQIGHFVRQAIWAGL